MKFLIMAGLLSAATFSASVGSIVADRGPYYCPKCNYPYQMCNCSK